MPYGKGSGDSLVRYPGGNGHHSNTSVLDLLHSQAGELLRVKSTLPLGESKRIISVVSGDGLIQDPLTVVSGRLEHTSSEEDLKPSGHGYHLDGVQRSGVGDIGEGYSRGGGEVPGTVGGRAENIGSSGSKVKGEVYSELLNHESDGGNHGNTSVLDLSILEPLDSRGLDVLEDLASKRGNLVSGLDGDTESLIDSGVYGNRSARGNIGRCESRCRSSEEGENSGGLHGGGGSWFYID